MKKIALLHPSSSQTNFLLQGLSVFLLTEYTGRLKALEEITQNPTNNLEMPQSWKQHSFPDYELQTGKQSARRRKSPRLQLQFRTVEGNSLHLAGILLSLTLLLTFFLNPLLPLFIMWGYSGLWILDICQLSIFYLLDVWLLEGKHPVDCVFLLASIKWRFVGNKFVVSVSFLIYNIVDTWLSGQSMW